ncbi:MAG: hypothetical protein OXG81_08000 [Acidobacteria bacterium]|nr:hypothetical protein [Acidobacteriota bacterium]
MQRTPYGGGPERHSRTRATRCRNEAARSPAARGLYPVERPAVTSRERSIPTLKGPPRACLLGVSLLLATLLVGLPPLLGQTERLFYRDGQRVIFLTAAEEVLLQKSKAGEMRLRRAEAEGPVAVRSPSVERDASGDFPVFRTDTGQLVSPVGGVILSLDRSWSKTTVDSFLEANELNEVEALGLPNVYLVTTEPGLKAIEVANRLALLPGVTASSPNLWRQEVEQ